MKLFRWKMDKLSGSWLQQINFVELWDASLKFSRERLTISRAIRELFRKAIKYKKL